MGFKEGADLEGGRYVPGPLWTIEAADQDRDVVGSERRYSDL